MTNAYLLEHMNDIDKIAKSMSRYTDNYEDIRQEMCVACLELETDQPFKYVISALVNKSIDYLKSRKHNYSYGDVYSHTSLEALLSRPASSKTASPGYSSPGHIRMDHRYADFLSTSPWNTTDVLIYVISMVSSLTDAEQSLLYNYYWVGYTQERIAKMEHVSRSMISKRLTIVLDKLRRRYNER